MTILYDWIRNKAEKDDLYKEIFQLMKKHPGMNWKCSTERAHAKNKFVKIGMSMDQFDTMFEEYLKDLTDSCLHDRGHKCFYMRREIKSKPISGSVPAPKGHRMGGKTFPAGA